MDEDCFNMGWRKFLKEVGVASQLEIDKLVREHSIQGGVFRRAWCSPPLTLRR